MRRIYSHTLPSIKGLYTNDPHQLVRIDVDNVPLASCEVESAAASAEGNDENEIVFALVVSQIDKSRDVCYTLNVYSTAPFRFYPAPKPPQHKLELPGSWTTVTCGGPPSSHLFHRNPQYRYILTSIHLLCVVMMLDDIMSYSATVMQYRDEIYAYF